MSELADGGRNAARGLRYQYLRTLEALMDIVEQSDHDAQSVHVEGLQTPDAVQADSVDYELTNGSGRLLSVVQVKARAPGRAMGSGEIFRVLAALVRDRDACRYELLTNAAAGRSAEHLLAALRSDGDAETLRSKIDEILAGVSAMSSRDQLSRLDKKHLIRLRRAAVLFDSRHDAEIIDGLILRLRDYRNQRRAGLGEQSAGLMVGYLISEIFKRAGSAAEATFSIAPGYTQTTSSGAICTATPTPDCPRRPAAMRANTAQRCDGRDEPGGYRDHGTGAKPRPAGLTGRRRLDPGRSRVEPVPADGSTRSTA